MHTISRLQRIAERPRQLIWGYLLLIAAAEFVIAFVNVHLGVFLHLLILVALCLHSALGPIETECRLVLALTLAPLIRLLSLSMPLLRFPQMLWYPIVSIPLLSALWLVVRQLGLPRRVLSLCPGNLVTQLLLMGAGLGLGAVEYAILGPSLVVNTFNWSAFWLPALNLVVFTGFTEELIFRGLLQAVAPSALGRWALVYVSLLFATMHIGYRSVPDVVIMFGVGLLFAYVVRWSGSIVGVSLAHGLTNVTLFLIMPYLAQRPSESMTGVAIWGIRGGTMIALLTIASLVWQAIRSRKVSRPGIRLPEPVAGLDVVDNSM